MCLKTSTKNSSWKNWREFSIAWIIGTVTFQKIQFLRIIYLFRMRELMSSMAKNEISSEEATLRDILNGDMIKAVAKLKESKVHCGTVSQLDLDWGGNFVQNCSLLEGGRWSKFWTKYGLPRWPSLWMPPYC